MDSLKTPLKGVTDDLKGRLACYKKDWLDSCNSGPRCKSFLFSCSKASLSKQRMQMFISASIQHFRILAPAAYIFFASALPVVAFGEQLSRETGHFLGLSDIRCFNETMSLKSSRCFMLRRELKH